jgi:hypothetical protein
MDLHRFIDREGGDLATSATQSFSFSGAFVSLDLKNGGRFLNLFGNDPSAGSPTETLLRLLLPLNDQVLSSFRHTGSNVATRAGTNPRISLNRSIGSSDGRCVQRAGT